MTKRLLVTTTALGLILGTAAFAQAPRGSSSTNTNPSAQTQTHTPSTAPSAQTAPSTSINSSAQTQTPATSTTTSQSSPSSSNSSPAAQTNSTSGPAQAQTNNPANAPAEAQTNDPAPANNQAQQAPNGGTNANNTAQTSSTNVNAPVTITDQQRTRISQSVARLNVQPLTNVTFHCPSAPSFRMMFGSKLCQPTLWKSCHSTVATASLWCAMKL